MSQGNRRRRKWSTPWPSMRKAKKPFGQVGVFYQRWQTTKVFSFNSYIHLVRIDWIIAWHESDMTYQHSQCGQNPKLVTAFQKHLSVSKCKFMASPDSSSPLHVRYWKYWIHFFCFLKPCQPQTYGMQRGQKLFCLVFWDSSYGICVHRGYKNFPNWFSYF